MEELSGFLNIDKPSGKTSHDVCDIVRKILNIEKAGHAGTLDPKVTGVLPVAIGKATKLLQYLETGKEYVGLMWLHEDIPQEEIEKIVKKEFLGKIKQTPPKRSAVKRQEREREIYSFEILEKDEKKVLFKVNCEAGTYIRKLIHDLGEKLIINGNKIGAHMLELRRTRAGRFEEKDSITLYQLQEAFESGEIKKYLLPMEIVTKDRTTIEVKEDALTKIYNGSPIYSEYFEDKKDIDKLKKDDVIALVHDKKLVEMAKVTLEANQIAVPMTVIK